MKLAIPVPAPETGPHSFNCLFYSDIGDVVRMSRSKDIFRRPLRYEIVRKQLDAFIFASARLQDRYEGEIKRRVRTQSVRSFESCQLNNPSLHSFVQFVLYRKPVRKRVLISLHIRHTSKFGKN